MKLTSLLVVGLSVLSTAIAEPMHKVVRENVRESGLVATYLRPKGDQRVPALIVLGGSQGGIPTSAAYRFAEHGWGVLAVAYFGAEGLPPSLKNVPLEYFDRAVTWLNRRADVSSEDLSLVGTSRGAELALLLASHRPAFKRVVAIAPSYVVWGPVGVVADKTASAWTIAGQPLPFVSFLRPPDYSAKPYRGTPDFLWALQQSDVVDRARIPVEQIQGAVLLLSGEDDQIWPSALMARMVMRRLATAKHRYRYEHVSFPGAGHLIEPGSDPGLTEAKHPTGMVLAFGGTKAGNRAAQEQGWIKTLEFLRQKTTP